MEFELNSVNSHACCYCNNLSIAGILSVYQV